MDGRCRRRRHRLRQLLGFPFSTKRYIIIDVEGAYLGDGKVHGVGVLSLSRAPAFCFPFQIVFDVLIRLAWRVAFELVFVRLQE